MLTSKQLIDKTGISRATLNNYIARGLLPKPLVTKPDSEGRGPRQIGFFPENSIERIEKIQNMKRGGLSMEQIAAQLQKDEGDSRPSFQVDSTSAAVLHHPSSPATAEQLTLTMDQIPYPAYMVNPSFEITWFNGAARETLPDVFTRLPQHTEDRSVFRLLLNSNRNSMNHEPLLRLNLALAKERMGRSSITKPLLGMSAGNVLLLEQLYDETEAAQSGGTIVDIPVSLENGPRKNRNYSAYASYFREGILVILMPVSGNADELLKLLSRRDLVIRNLLSKRLPTLTDLAVLVMDLQDSVKICSELPPEEYFELVNQIWSTAGGIFRKYYGTHGKHVGDGMVYYFFPQPDCSYIMNALICAGEIKEAVAKISKEWQLRKKWTTELYLNRGLNEGQEWLGTFQTATTIEFAVLGDTINHTARLSDFARYGTIWATKNFIGKIPAPERSCVKFGVRRKGSEGEPIFVESTYSRLCNLVDLESGRHEKLRDIAALPITEIVEVNHFTQDRS
jgi:class 3 adenylate cyclase/DNA-binding transcriptional MerR regulator